VRSDRNLYSKQLTETQDEIAEIKRRYKIVNHQISQLKEEIDAKEVALAKEHFEHKKKDKTIEEQSRMLEKLKNDIKEKEEKLKNFVNFSNFRYVFKGIN
jgi:septal ring factor EnvC (AmiA/AmiB activator)